MKTNPEATNMACTKGLCLSHNTIRNASHSQKYPATIYRALCLYGKADPSMHLQLANRTVHTSYLDEHSASPVALGTFLLRSGLLSGLADVVGAPRGTTRGLVWGLG
jgi:hypothetical protein